MFRNLGISSLLLMGAVSAAHADVYRWVDDHGGVHYSDQWVPGSQVVKTTHSHSASEAAPQPTASAAPRPGAAPVVSQSAQQDAATRAVKQDLAKTRDQQCKDAKDRYDKSIQARRIYKVAPSDKSQTTDRPDDREYMSDEEADAYRVKARQEMQDFCGPAATKTAAE